MKNDFIVNQRVGLFIPTLNAGERWIEVLNMISRQNLSLVSKFIIDSGSKDQTVKQAREHGFNIIQIDKGDFNHGKSRQQLIETDTNSEICIFLTQDAIPATEDSLYQLILPFQNPQIGLVYGRQLARKNAEPLEVHARLFNYPDQDEIVSIGDLDRKGFKVFFCSNSFSAFRKSALMDVGGFPKNSIMGEDAIVAAKMLSKGYKKAYVAKAMVYHSHSYTLMEEFKRYFDTRVFHEQNQWLIEKYGKPTGEGIKFIKSELSYALKYDWKSIFKSIPSMGAKWLGYHLGKYFRIIPKFILRKISMHGFYWEK